MLNLIVRKGTTVNQTASLLWGKTSPIVIKQSTMKRRLKKKVGLVNRKIKKK